MRNQPMTAADYAENVCRGLHLPIRGVAFIYIENAIQAALDEQAEKLKAQDAARATLVDALFVERKAWQKLAALTVGDDTSADDCLLACQERDAAAEALDDAAIAYLVAAASPPPAQRDDKA